MQNYASRLKGEFLNNRVVTSPLKIRKFLGVIGTTALTLNPLYAESIPAFVAAMEPLALAGDTRGTETRVEKFFKSEDRLSAPSQALSLLALAYAQNNEVEQAEVVLRALRGMFPDFEQQPSSKVLNSIISEEQGDLDQAIRDLSGLRGEQALFREGILLEKSGKSFAALSKFREFEEKFPRSPLLFSARLAMVQSCLTLREIEQAEKILAAVGAAVPAQDAALFHFLRGRVAFEKKEWDQASLYLSKVIEGASPTLLAPALSLKGLAALHRLDLPGAEMCFQRLVALDHPIGLKSLSVGLTRVYLSNDNPSAAVALLNAALPKLSDKESRSTLLTLRGLAFQRSGQAILAVQDFDAVVGLRFAPWNGQALVLKGTTLWFENATDRLTTEYWNDLKKFKQNSKGANFGVEMEVCDLLVAEAKLAQRKPLEAEAVYKDMLLKPLSAQLTVQTVSGLVTALVQQSEFDEAAKKLEELMVRFGEDRQVLRFGLLAEAQLFWNRGSYEDAHARYLRFQEMFPDDENAPLALYMSGRSLEKLNRPAEARQAWAGLRSRHPSSPLAFGALVRSANLADKEGLTQEAQVLYGEISKSENSQAAESGMFHIAKNQLEADQTLQGITSLDQFVKRFPHSTQRVQVDQWAQEAFEGLARTAPAQLPNLQSQFADSVYGGEALYWMGMKAYEANTPDVAWTHFSNVLQNYSRSPSAIQALFYKGQCEVQLRRYETALVTLGEFVKFNADHDLAVLARLQRGKCFMSQKMWDGAAMEFEKVTKLAPYSGFGAEALYQWGVALGENQDWAGRARLHEQFVKDYPEHKRANQVCWDLGQMRKREGSYVEALAWFKKVRPAENVATETQLQTEISALEKLTLGARLP